MDLQGRSPARLEGGGCAQNLVGDWDWVTASQCRQGIGGAVGAGTPTAIPDSLYLTPKPGFFGSNPWPWVDPATGTVATLPAKARFDTTHGLGPAR